MITIPRLEELQNRLDDINPDFYFDLKTRRFRLRDGGKFVSRKNARAIAKRYSEQQQSELARLATDAYTGKMGLKEFQLEASLRLKQIHLSQAFLGRNGTDRITPEDFLIVARELRVQYYSGIDDATGKRFGLKHLTADLSAGRVSSEAWLKERLRKFGNSGKYTFWAMRRSAALEAGKTSARRQINSRDECDDCRAYAALQWQPISRLILPTKKCACKTNCKCTVLFR